MSLVGQRVRITFNTNTWPVGHGVYTYEGHDETGHWVRRKDGVQRHFAYGDVVAVDPLPDEAEVSPEEETENY